MIYVLIGAVILLLLLMTVFGRGGITEKKKMPRLLMWKLIYTDMAAEHKREDITYGSILYSEKYDLKGKPDMIYRHRITGDLLPVEIKSGQTDWPHEGDMLQVGAYMLIVEDIYHKRPKKAVISYKNTQFVVRNTHLLRKNVIDTAERMRRMLETDEEEAEPSFAKCRHCVCNGTVCDEAECLGENL
ncbi:MAG: CRISPR-associated protein Cas4 [Clostridiales bacterium]|nr:CRISPR-associated protein Cas4 [Clostridiales bacterium]